MNKIILSLLVVSAAAIFGIGTSAQTTVESVLGEIRQSQNVEKNEDIKCDSVSDEQSEKLGEAIMAVMHPNESEHELMDQMMGGEGSNSLKAMETIMGKRYLGCISGINYANDNGMMGQMGSGMMGGMYGYANSGMMDNWNGWGWMNMMGNYGILGLTLMILFWVLVILAVIYLLRYVFGRGDAGRGEKSALDVLNERYAKGEINKEEYEAKKKDIK